MLPVVRAYRHQMNVRLAVSLNKAPRERHLHARLVKIGKAIFLADSLNAESRLANQSLDLPRRECVANGDAFQSVGPKNFLPCIAVETDPHLDDSEYKIKDIIRHFMPLERDGLVHVDYI